MIFSVIAFSLMNAVVKYLKEFNVYQIVFFRSIGTLAFTIPLMIKYKIPFFGNKKKLLLLRGFLGVISLTCFFESLNYLAVGTAVSLRYTAPIFASLFALILLKEKIKPIQWLLFVLTFIGVLIVKGFGINVNVIGIFLVIISSLFLGLVFVVIRMIGDKDHTLVIINYFMIMAFIFGGLMSINVWKHPNFAQWFLLLSLGVLGYIGQFFMTKAFQMHETNIIVPLKYLEVVFTILFGILWFGDNYNFISLVGILLILLGLIFNFIIKNNDLKIE